MPEGKKQSKNVERMGRRPRARKRALFAGREGGRAFQETRKFLMCMLNYTYARARRRSRRFNRSGANKTTEVEKTVELW